MLPKVSVVIPVYNVKREYMRSCLDSVINQSYKDLEIILVDDGSTDDSGVFCDEIAQEDTRVKVIHQENAGVSAARNNGTAAATGAYVMYVDADDIIAPYALQNGVETAVKYNADLVIGAVRKIRNYQEFGAGTAPKDREIKVLDTDKFDELRRVYFHDPLAGYRGIEGDGYINRGPFSRIIKREIASGISFPQYPLGEDVIWNMRLLNHCQTVCICKEVWYGYLIYESSAIRKYYGNRIEIAAGYLNLLRQENHEFYQRNQKSYALNTAVEFYSILQYELLSDKCEMSIFQKINVVRAMMVQEPWNVLKKKELVRQLPPMYRVLIGSAGFGGWIFILNLWGKIKRIKGVLQ